jgi:hypothetical protein
MVQVSRWRGGMVPKQSWSDEPVEYCIAFCEATGSRYEAA